MINEFKDSIFNVLIKLVGENSVLLAIVYTIGHIIIAMLCNKFITGAQINLAAIDAIVEPIVNGFWFYFLHRLWKNYKINR